MLLMWSNEEGVNMEAVNVEIAESFVDLFDAGVVTEMKVAFVDDVATNEFGEEVAYGIGMEALNGEGTIMAKENGFVFVPAKKTTVAPIGNKRVAFIDRAADNNGVLVPFMKGGQEIVPAQKAAEIADQIVAANNQAVYFVPKTTDGQAVNMKNIVTNVGIVVDAKDEQGNIVKVNKIVGTTIKVGQAYINDMFISYKEIAGEKVLANNKKHIIEQAINTESGILLVLSC